MFLRCFRRKKVKDTQVTNPELKAHSGVYQKSLESSGVVKRINKLSHVPSWKSHTMISNTRHETHRLLSEILTTEILRLNRGSDFVSIIRGNIKNYRDQRSLQQALWLKEKLVNLFM